MECVSSASSSRRCRSSSKPKACHTSMRTRCVAGSLIAIVHVSRSSPLLFSRNGTTNQGWRTADVNAPKWLLERDGERQFSDIPIFAADEVPSSLRDDPSWRATAFIIRGNDNLLQKQQALSREALLKDPLNRKRLVSTGFSWTISKNRGEGTSQVLLDTFLKGGMYEVLRDKDQELEPPYAFDRNVPLEGMPSSADIHPVIRSWNTSAFEVPRSAVTIQMLGSLGSAVGWHSHGATVQMNVVGRKRWFLYPLDSYPPGDGPGGCFSLTDWLQIIYPTLKKEHKPIECILEAGDMIYVPDGWYHAVINLADSVAISVQSIYMEPDHQEYFKGVSLSYIQKLREEDPSAVKAIEHKAREYLSKGLRNDLHARRVLFYCLFDSKRSEAIEIILQGTDRDPFHVPLQFELSSLLVKHLRAGDEVALEQFKMVMKSWEPYLKKNLRNQKALWILSKYERAIGNEVAADQYHERLVELNSKGIDR